LSQTKKNEGLGPIKCRRFFPVKSQVLTPVILPDASAFFAHCFLTHCCTDARLNLQVDKSEGLNPYETGH